MVDGILRERTLLKVAATVNLVIAAGAVMYTRAPPVKYKMVDQLTAADDGREIKVHGWVRVGSLVDSAGAHRFSLTSKGETIAVVVQDPVSDCLREQSELVAHGTLHGDVLQASELQCRCSSPYRGPETTRAKFE